MSEVKIGKNFRNVVPQGIAQIVSPAENGNGLTIRTCASNPRNGFVGLYCSETAPLAAAPGNANRLIFAANGNTLEGSSSSVFMPYPLFIPAGLGLWVTSGPFSGSTPTGGGIALTWDFVG
ncbi:hypothetical protein [Pseudomonas syringae]|uniref:hypothetical protein n=1 Tax=Pseudomonas syringae TaxID=317 RepID=UPI000ADD3A21|nr:hypothetical protein [Pseudomonas syringae]